ncbi:hypothetical protein FKM82_003318 [Ascaphus truei]
MFLVPDAQGDKVTCPSQLSSHYYSIQHYFNLFYIDITNHHRSCNTHYNTQAKAVASSNCQHNTNRRSSRLCKDIVLKKNNN